MRWCAPQKSSISIADPDGGRNIRLKGAIYEQSFNAGEGLRAEIEKAQQQTTGEMLKAAFSEHEKSVRAELSESEKRISAAILDHDRKLSSAMSQRTKGMLRMVSQTWLTIVLVSALLIASSAGILWWQGQQILENYTTIREQKSTQAMLSERNSGVQLLDLRRAETPLREGEPGSGTVRRGLELDDTGGEIAHDGAGKQLLSALEQLQQDYSKRLDEWENAFAEWRTMSGLIQRRTRR